MIRRKPLAQQSATFRAALVDYHRARQAAFDRDRGQCQAADRWVDVACWGRTDPHHIAPTGRYPELRADVTNIVTLCRGHHNAAHDNPVRARELGLLV